jgi:hypothetical protein
VRNLYAVLLIVTAIGCGSQPGLKSAPVDITGKVSLKGQPIGDVAVTFQPLDQGHVKSMPVKPDGSFEGSLISGTYAYAITQSTGANAATALAKVDPQYLEPNMQRTVTIEPGKEVLIALD